MLENDALVKFVISGMQKAGTTALHHYLNLHPKLCMSSPKEIHYFDNEGTVDWSAPIYADYEAHFSQKLADQICGEATPIYTFWPNSLERIQAYNPDMKLIIMLRDRCERAYSHWAMEVSRGLEVLSFSDAIRAGRERYDEVNSSAPVNRLVSYVERGFYAPQLRRAKSLFGEENLLVIEGVDLQKKPNVILDVVCEFLDVQKLAAAVEPIFIRPVEPLGTLDPMSGADLEHLTELYKFDVMDVEKLYPSII